MGLSLAKATPVERRARRQPRRRHDLAKCIRETLLALGGEAHRKTVIEQLAREFGLDPRHAPAELEISVIRAYEAVLHDEVQRAAFGFHLPFGAGSHRWGVKLGEVELPN
ncbi:hypothetical protein [Phenylobacterium sp.]|jgi:hypothetical protein|uniref:hypothetical protein n=1 Tax=Phenylobacterium sp. TaxID=1871053 RepID=UPI002F3E698F